MTLRTYTLRTYTKVTAYLLAGCGFAATCLVEEVGPAFLVISAVFMVAAMALNATRAVIFTDIVWNTAAALAFALFVADYLAVSGSLVGAGTRFLTALVVIKLFGLETPRDHVLLKILVLFQLLGAAASTVSPLFFVLLSFYIICGIWAMVTLNIKRDSEEWGQGKAAPTKGAQGAGGPLFGLGFFAGTAGATVLSIIITIGLFFIIPRMAVGFFDLKRLNTVKVSGFSDLVDLGSIGAVKLDPTPVMRVEVPKDAGALPTLYMRGSSLDRFNGLSWEKTFTSKTPMKGPRPGLFTRDLRPGEPLKELKLVEHKVMLEALSTDVVFTLPGWTMLSTSLRTLWADDAGSTYFPSVPYKRVEYTAWSPEPIAGGRGRPRWVSEVTDSETHEMVAFLQLLEETSNDGTSRIERLSRSIASGTDLYVKDKALADKNKAPADKDGAPAAGPVAGIEDVRAVSPITAATAIELHLKTSYRYTLDPASGDGETPLDDFLFHTQEGYCEHFATAMVIMLRTLGIPSRMVTGFLEGTWNGYGNYYLIRQQDAHTWVEALVDNRWVSFDPTPSVGLLPGASVFSSLTLYLDTLKWRWNRQIINFTLSDQLRGAVAFESGAMDLKNRLGNLLRSMWANLKEVTSRLGASGKDAFGAGPFWTDRGQTATFAALALVAALIIVLARFRRARQSVSRKVPAFYTSMLNILKGRGLTREVSETATEFALRCSAPEVGLITESYHRTRFGNRAPEAEELGEIMRSLDALRKEHKGKGREKTGKGGGLIS